MPRKKKPTAAKNMPPTKGEGPYLSLAVLCENVLVDKDGVHSLIRIVDKVTVYAQTSSGEPVPPAALAFIAPPFPFQIAVGFRSGIARGQRTLKLISKLPSGGVISETALPISFDADKEQLGVFVRVGMTLAAKEEGVYWIDVLLNDVLMTKIPLWVKFERIESGSSHPPLSPSPAHKQ
jgi:hypothetical protein